MPRHKERATIEATSGADSLHEDREKHYGLHAVRYLHGVLFELAIHGLYAQATLADGAGRLEGRGFQQQDLLAVFQLLFLYTPVSPRGSH